MPMGRHSLFPCPRPDNLTWPAVSMACPLWTFHVDRIRPRVGFCARLLSLSRTLFRFTHIAACVGASVLFTAE